MAATGLFLTLDRFSAHHGHGEMAAVKMETEGEGGVEEFMELVHHGGGTAGGVYHVALAVLVLFQGVTGAILFAGWMARRRRGPGL